MTSTEFRLQLAQKSLLGLSIGDAFGQQFFIPVDELNYYLQNQIAPPTPWYFTDDTIMAMGIYDCLQDFGYIHQDSLAKVFAKNYMKDNSRGYGGTAHAILRNIYQGMPWKQASSEAFDGMGSMGNGGAMRAALIGAYFYDDLEKVIEQARLSSEVTHAHQEAQIGTIAVALAAAIAYQNTIREKKLSSKEFLSAIIELLPESETCSYLKRGLNVSKSSNIQSVVSILGDSSDMTAQHTVPFCLWVASHHLYHFENAIWHTVNGLGDRDTTCAIVGSIVALSAPEETIPLLWKQATESIYNSDFLIIREE
ncbi:MAG: ADP-ribosylglycohydrolase family protein [Raineya sp.]|jgi:ADP-ribosylglycohydrolase|nr:ADP-ribosylglycohydrolase family protein [Raineya sp.]